MTALKAYQVGENSEGHCVIVFATNGATARREGGNELNLEFEEVDTCTRKPQFDEYAPGPVPPKVLIENGWWFECVHCARTVSEEMASDIEDAGLNPENFEIIEAGDTVYCSRGCQSAETRERQSRANAIVAFTELVHTKFPGSLVTHVHVYGTKLEPTDARGARKCVAYFTFPGGKNPAMHVFGSDHCEVFVVDVDAFKALYEKKVQA